MPLPPPVAASFADLEPCVRGALDDPPSPVELSVVAAGIRFAARAWGDPDDPPLLLVHGVTASSRVWWRLGPALATGLGRRVVAVDQAGHGRTVAWTGHHLIRDNAVDLAAFVAAAGLGGPDLRVVGHSWGALTVAALPIGGLRPEVLVLLDPPAMPVAVMATMLDDPVERHFEDVGEAVDALGANHPTWSFGDVVAKAEGLTQFDVAAVRAILLENGDWDAGLADLADPASSGLAVRVVRGEPAAGGLVPTAAAEAFAARIGEKNVLTIAGGSHSPMRNRAEATTLALLRALEPD